MNIEEALKIAESWMLTIKGVIGIAQGKIDEEDCITVFLSDYSVIDNIPDHINDIKVKKVIEGSFNAF